MIVQIYEIQGPTEAEKCIELEVNHIGSVLFSEDMCRMPSLKEVFRLTEGTPARNSLIPLFQDSNALFRALDYYRPHIVHFCENLTDRNGHEVDLSGHIQFQFELKQKFPDISIMRTIPIPQKGGSPNFPTLKIASVFEPVSDFFLTDTWLGMEPVKGFIGLTGKTTDWDMALRLVIQSNIPVVLAGGLSPENVFDAVVKVVPAGADSCTWTNKTDENGNPIRFRKDFLKVEKFINEVRRAQEELNPVIE